MGSEFKEKKMHLYEQSVRQLCCAENQPIILSTYKSEWSVASMGHSVNMKRIFTTSHPDNDKDIEISVTGVQFGQLLSYVEKLEYNSSISSFMKIHS
jgi:hypothetical protein